MNNQFTEEESAEQALTDDEIAAIEFFANPSCSIDDILDDEQFARLVDLAGGIEAAVATRTFAWTEAKRLIIWTDEFSELLDKHLPSIEQWTHAQINQLLDAADNAGDSQAALTLSTSRSLTSELLLRRSISNDFPELPVIQFLTCVAEAIISFPGSQIAISTVNRLRSIFGRQPQAENCSELVASALSENSARRIEAWRRIRDRYIEQGLPHRYIAATLLTTIGLSEREFVVPLERDAREFKNWADDVKQLLTTEAA